jgi:ferredoxin-NADP reductase
LLCGPDAMIAEVEQALIARGVPSARILSERFGYS